MEDKINLDASETLALISALLLTTVESKNYQYKSFSHAFLSTVESIRDNAFHALQCPARDDINSRRCNIAPGAWMGGDGHNFNKVLRGSFYLETRRNSPYAQGPTRP